MKTKMKAKPLTYGGVSIDEEAVDLRPRKPRKTKQTATDIRYEYRLTNDEGLYWTGPKHSPALEWPRQGTPDFDKKGQKWSSLSRTLQLWAEYNIAKAVQKADWPELKLEKFKITSEVVEAPNDQPVDVSKLVNWYAKHQRYDHAMTIAERLIKSGYDFKYLLEYRGTGDELPTHLQMRVTVFKKAPSYSGGSDEGDFITVALLEDKDMVFARVALGERVTRIINEEADIIYQNDPDPTQ